MLHVLNHTISVYKDVGVCVLSRTAVIYSRLSSVGADCLQYYLENE